MNKKNRFIKIAVIASVLFTFSFVSLTLARQIENQTQRQAIISTREQINNSNKPAVDTNRETFRNFSSSTNQEISKNTESLQNLLNRINNSQTIPEAQKNIISQKIQSQINNFEDIKTQLGNNEISSSSMANQRKMMQETTRNMRLIVPQANILVAANKILAVASMTTEIANKLQIRISELQNNGINTTSTTALFNDISAKVTDAQKMAQTAINRSQDMATSTVNISTQIKIDTSALQNARANIVLAQKDLQVARKEIGQLLKLIFPWLLMK